MEKRTTIRFGCGGDIYPAVERWAEENKFVLKENADAERLYQKGTGFWVAPSILRIRRENGQIVMEAYLAVNFFTRLMSLFILPSEIGIASGGMKAVVPRNMFRKQLNELLAELGAPPVL